MLDRWLARVFGRPHSAAADLYFTNAMTGIDGWRRLSATVFESEAAVLVVRNHLGVPLDLAGRRLIYLIDDDLGAAVRDPGLGAGYRFRLAMVELRAASRLRAEAERIVTTSGPLQRTLSNRLGRPVDLMVPYWSEALSDLAHFAPEAPPRIGYLGSLTHTGDLELALEILRRILSARPEVQVVMAANHKIPDWLSSHPGFRPIQATGWPNYRRGLADLGCQLLLYPLHDTPLNRARSANKLIEHGVAGGAALYPAHWPQSALVEEARAGLCLSDRVEDWITAALDLLDTPAELRTLAENGRALASRLNTPEPQRAYWRDAMDLAQTKPAPPLQA